MDHDKKPIKKDVDIKETENITEGELPDKFLENVTGGSFVPKPRLTEVTPPSGPNPLTYNERWPNSVDE